VAKLREVGTDEPVNGLQKIGKTCFGTIWLACTALDPCLQPIRNLVHDKTIKFKVSQKLLFLVTPFDHGETGIVTGNPQVSGELPLPVPTGFSLKSFNILE